MQISILAIIVVSAYSENRVEFHARVEPSIVYSKVMPVQSGPTQGVLCILGL